MIISTDSPNQGFSVIIIAFNSGQFLPACLQSIYHSTVNEPFETIVLDNGSPHPVPEDVKSVYPQVTWLHSEQNLGFGAGCNRAVQQAQYSNLFFVNPDTIVAPDTFSKMLEYFTKQPDTGVLGCKIFNGDGSLQWACRRSFPSPWAAIYKTLGLTALFPRSKRFGRYNMTYLDPDENAEVDAVSGSFFLVKKDVYEGVSGFDEDYFLYGEDLDIFYRIQKTGLINRYFSDTAVIHFKGQSFRTRRLRSYIDFYNAMLIFVRKHLEHFRPFPKFLLSMGVLLAAALGVFSRLVPQWYKLSGDLFAVLLSAVVVSRFNSDFLPLWTAVTATATLLPTAVSGDYVQQGFRFGLPVKWVLVGALFAGVSLAVVQSPMVGALALLPPLTTLIWRKAFYWGGYFANIFRGRFSRALILGNDREVLRYFDHENVLPGYELLGSMAFPGAEVSSEHKQIIIGDYPRLADVQKRTGIRELLVVADSRGRYGELPSPELLKKLKIGLKLLIGNPKSRVFVLVDLNFIR